MIFGLVLVLIGSFIFAWVIRKRGIAKFIFIITWLILVLVGEYLIFNSGNLLFIILGVVIALFMPIWLYMGSRSGFVLYYNSASSKLADNNATAEEAILTGLNKISYRKPFSELTNQDKQSIAKLFGRFNDVTIIKGLILECEKTQNIKPLTNKENLINFAKFIAKQQQGQG